MVFKKLAALTHSNNFIIVGLGNPGREYEFTRHNIGFLVVEALAAKQKVTLNKYKFKAITGEFRHAKGKVILVKPQTFMNLSGNSIGSFFRFYKPPIDQLMVIFDDLDLPFGSIRIRKSGGSSGQKGMKSIIDHLGMEDFPRIRVGIGRPPGRMASADFILKKFRDNERQDLDLILARCTTAVECFIDDGIESAMNQFNGTVFEDE